MRRVWIILFYVLCSIDVFAVDHYEAKIVRTYPHDVTSYTQGLFFYNGELIETTGVKGESTLRVVDLETGKPLRRFDFSGRYFVEGSAVLGDRLYILTWQNKAAFVYDASTLKFLMTYSYPREGWGLTSDGNSLIASDGTSTVYYLDSSFKVQRKISVTLNGRPLKYLNELEWIDGRIWANVYLTDMIVVIDPKTGEVESVIDCSLVYPSKLRSPKADVLNGIAVDQEGKIFITGKYWPLMYEITLVPSDRGNR